MEVDADVDPVSEPFTDHLDSLDRVVDPLVGLDPLVVSGDPTLERGDPEILRGLAQRGEFLRRVRPGVVVAADPAGIDGSSQQAVYRLAEHFPADVPQRLVDAGNRRAEDGASAVERMDVHALPDVLDAHRVLAEVELLEVVDGLQDGAGLAFESGLTPTDNALIRLELDEHVRTVGVVFPRNAKRLHAGDANRTGHRSEGRGGNGCAPAPRERRRTSGRPGDGGRSARHQGSSEELASVHAAYSCNAASSISSPSPGPVGSVKNPSTTCGTDSPAIAACILRSASSVEKATS